MKKQPLIILILLLVIPLISCKKNNDYQNNYYNDDSSNSANKYSNISNTSVASNFFDNKDEADKEAFDISNYDNVLHYDIENDLYLVGISKDGEEKIMVYYQGETCIINHFFSNGYEEMPQVELKDVDDDGENEVIVSVRKKSGNQTTFSFFVCDKVEGVFGAVSLENIGELVRENITYSYDSIKKEFIFICGDNNIVADLPDYIDKYPLTGNVEYEHRYWFDCNKMELTVCPEIELENSVPEIPVYILFEIEYNQGEITIEFKSFEYSDYYK